MYLSPSCETPEEVLFPSTYSEGLPEKEKGGSPVLFTAHEHLKPS